MRPLIKSFLELILFRLITLETVIKEGTHPFNKVKQSPEDCVLGVCCGNHQINSFFFFEVRNILLFKSNLIVLDYTERDEPLEIY